MDVYVPGIVQLLAAALPILSFVRLATRFNSSVVGAVQRCQGIITTIVLYCYAALNSLGIQRKCELMDNNGALRMLPCN